MKLVVVSPPDDRPHESRVCRALFEAGMERYHLRKPLWTEAATAAWLEALPTRWRSRVVLHGHHGLCEALGACGVHFRDDDTAPTEPAGAHAFASRACHSAGAVAAALGRYDAVLVGPVFASRSKPGYGPMPERERDGLLGLLATRARTAKTEVIAIGGVDASSFERCHAMGFDGAAVLGALWNTPDPVAAFFTLKAAAESTNHHAEGSSP